MSLFVHQAHKFPLVPANEQNIRQGSPKQIPQHDACFLWVLTASTRGDPNWNPSPSQLFSTPHLHTQPPSTPSLDVASPSPPVSSMYAPLMCPPRPVFRSIVEVEAGGGLIGGHDCFGAFCLDVRTFTFCQLIGFPFNH